MRRNGYMCKINSGYHSSAELTEGQGFSPYGVTANDGRRKRKSRTSLRPMVDTRVLIVNFLKKIRVLDHDGMPWHFFAVNETTIAAIPLTTATAPMM
ncbi:MAG: hypothetical protein METHP_01032 [Methanoregula sp. SKADARSKE-2]|nr:MAG: hypothetical protein METHP_01032 [Methanoregula sp. SKADARSKE-2]